MLNKLVKYINSHEDWLMERILKYAHERDYTKYTSTLKEAWRLSISGLSESLVKLIKEKGEDIELGPDENYSSDPATQFGIIEAKRHRERGIRLDMFLGLMKYYKQSYEDLIKESKFKPLEKKHFNNLIIRFFDRVEIAFCSTWVSSEENKLIEELQNSNRIMTNEKNKYLTIFESLSVAVLIIDPKGKIENMNFTASKIFDTKIVPGSQYYKENKEEIILTDKFPWLTKSYNDFIKTKKEKAYVENYLESKNQFFHIYFSRSLDVSGKYSGTIIIIEDITKQKEMENELERLATTDPLTGAKNRRSFLIFFEHELAKNKRYTKQLALLMIDIDNFKDVNDKYGHDIGDEVLKLLVTEAENIIRATDLFARWGGEEFIVLLPESDINQASEVAERIRDNLSKIKVKISNDKSIQFTVSIGLTIVKDTKASINDIIKKADKALYLAKSQGRNRVNIL